MERHRLNPIALAIIREDQEAVRVRNQRFYLRRAPRLGPVEYRDRPVIDFGNPNSPYGSCRITLTDFTYPFSGADEFAEQGTRSEVFLPKAMVREAMKGLKPGKRGKAVKGEGYYREHEWNNDQKQIGSWETTEITRIGLILEMEMPLEGTSVIVRFKTEPKRKLSDPLQHMAYFGRIPRTQMIFKSHHKSPAVRR